MSTSRYWERCESLWKNSIQCCPDSKCPSSSALQKARRQRTKVGIVQEMVEKPGTQTEAIPLSWNVLAVVGCTWRSLRNGLLFAAGYFLLSQLTGSHWRKKYHCLFCTTIRTKPNGLHHFVCRSSYLVIPSHTLPYFCTLCTLHYLCMADSHPIVLIASHQSPS